MGQEILYCGRCQVRVVGSDFEKGEAYRVDEQVVCQKCAMTMLSSAPVAVQQQILEQKKRALDRKMAPRAPSSIWRGLLSVSPALRAAQAAEKTPRSQITAIVGVGLALVLLVAMLLLSSGSPHPPPAPAVKPPPVVTPGPTPADAAAEARQELEAIARKRKELAAAELKALLSRARELGVAAEYQKAADLLVGARKNHAEVEWTKPIDDRIKELEAAMAAEFPPLRGKAVDARKRNGTAELGLIREKIARWGSARYAEELEKALAEVFPPVAPEKDGVLKLWVGEAVIQGNNRLTRTKGDWSVTQGWRNLQDYLEWSVAPRQAGPYTIRLHYALPKEYNGTPMGGDVQIAVAGGDSKQFTLEPTGTIWGDYKTITYGTITLPATTCTISVRPVRITHSLMSLRSVELVPK